MLPHLELGQVLSLGCPSASSLATLSKLADTVAVWAKIHEHDRLRLLIAKESLRNVTLLEAERGSLPIPDSDIDVVLVANPGLVRSRLGDANAHAEIERVLKSDGLLYVESYSSLERWLGRGRADSSFDRIGDRLPLWVAPAFDEMRMAAPCRTAERSNTSSGASPADLAAGARQASAPCPGPFPPPKRSLHRRAKFVSRARRELANGPPAYVKAIAASAGATLDGVRWAFAAPGDYDSQKGHFSSSTTTMGSRGQSSRSLVTRDTTLASKTSGERSHFWRSGASESRERVPPPLFRGQHAGLAVLGETALRGVPFRRQMKADGEWQHARRVVEWLFTLGVATVHRPDNGSILAAASEALLDRFDELYRPARDTSRFLTEQVAALAAAGDGMCLVFQHGDPGPWNLLVTPEGQPAFLDWEAADAEGMPLWDLFHFLRSFDSPSRRRREDTTTSEASPITYSPLPSSTVSSSRPRPAIAPRPRSPPGSCSRSSTSAGCIAPSRRHLACGKTGCSRAATSTFCVSPSTDGTPLGCNVSFTAGSPLSHRCGSSSVPLRRRSLP